MKRIVACSDGTWNRPDDKFEGKVVRTNVQKLFEAIAHHGTDKRTGEKVFQAKFYDEGIGAGGNRLSRLLNGASGNGIDDNILDIYKFIVWNYEPGDEIYLFGFSRGAYTVRSVAGLIRNSGILRENNLRRINEAFAIYRARKTDEKNLPDGVNAKAFRRAHCYEKQEVKFIGVWDTVGSLGLPLQWFQWYNKRKYAFHDATLSAIVDNAFHALAIDERRKSFVPTLWQQSPAAAARAVPQVLEQMWFPGVHSNVGGGYPDEGLSDIALDWLATNANKVGLDFDPGYIEKEVKVNHAATLYNSVKFPFSLLPKYVRQPLTTPNANESFHETVFRRMDEVMDYRPRNVRRPEVKANSTAGGR